MTGHARGPGILARMAVWLFMVLIGVTAAGWLGGRILWVFARGEPAWLREVNRAAAFWTVCLLLPLVGLEVGSPRYVERLPKLLRGALLVITARLIVGLLGAAWVAIPLIWLTVDPRGVLFGREALTDVPNVAWFGPMALCGLGTLYFLVAGGLQARKRG